MEYRQAGNKPMEALCKLFINSLYGKFGQAGFLQREIGAVDPYEVYSMQHLNIDTGEYSRLVALGGRLYEETKQGESHNSLPAIAAHITAYARLYLWRLLRLAGPNNCYYVDTDSLLVNQAGWDNLRSTIAPVRLGALKPELISGWAEIRAPKDYALEGRERIKGIRADAENLAEGVYDQAEFDHLRGMLQAGDIGNYHVRRVVKHQSRRIYSGRLLASGWVEPWNLAEFEVYSPVEIPVRALQTELF
jgi:hypothetical protein